MTLVVTVVGMFLFLYLWLLPKLVESTRVHQQVNNALYKYTGVNYVIVNPKLKTGFSTNIAFSTDEFQLLKTNDKLIYIKNINTKFSFSDIFIKKLKVQVLGADDIFVDVNKVLSIVPKTEKKESKLDWKFDFLNSLTYVKRIKILFNDGKGTYFDINAKNLQIDHTKKRCKYVHYDIFAKITKGKHIVNVKLKDENKVFIKKRQLFINNGTVQMNNSIVHINAKAHKNKKFRLEVFSNNFDIENITDLINSNLIIPNGSELLSSFEHIHGSFNFKFLFTNKNMSGDIILNKVCLILKPVHNLPVHIHKGRILLGKKDILLKNFEGYYASQEANNLKFNGKINNYAKNLTADIIADVVVTNDFAQNYLSKIMCYPMGIIGKADTKLILKYANGAIDLTWLFKIDPECSLLVGGEPLGKYKVERVLVSKMKFIGSKLYLNSMEYFVTVPGIAQYTKRRILSLNGIIDFSKGIDVREMGFDIKEPMPSEFLNMIIRQDFFKRGTILGRLKAIDGPKGVKLFGSLDLSKIRVPSQRLYIESGRLETDFNTINVKSSGRYRRTKYHLTGNFVNNIAFPIIINDINLTIDNMNIDKMLKSFNQQGTEQIQTKADDVVSEDSDTPTFDLANLIIKKCAFNLAKGSYKLINFGNLHANLSLDEKSLLKLDSNKFDFAEGHSSCHARCDLKNHKYDILLGVKDVNSDIIATSLLNLEKEISGKASGIIRLNTDESLKLNGHIKFLVQNGTIGKIGLIEYVLKFASIFRNPLAMISPTTIWDIINVPDGKFNKIEGSLEISNNVIEHIKIKSFAPQLSAYIAGRFDLDSRDASLRIYTRLTNKKKGVYGVLRNISLSSIASRVSLGARNDSNYYASELSELPSIDANDKDCQIFLTKVEGDIEKNNFISSLKRIK